MTTILPAEFITSPLMAAANLIGVVTSDRALHDAKQSIYLWQNTAHRCMLLSNVQLCQCQERMNAEQHTHPG